VEGVDVNPSRWQGRRVFVTGHTGFKGAWLAMLLADAGAEVHGYALDPPSEPSFFRCCRVEAMLASHDVGDVRDRDRLLAAMRRARPDVILHLAAQSLVRRSYREPIETYATNVMGTVHVLEAARQVAGVRAVVNVTSDKCYENQEREEPYRESDPMGGHDPYSSSKGCAELVTTSYARSFLRPAGIRVASARAGNVIGGGDWAEDRLVPDLLRAMAAGQPLAVRSPDATRPWQHVLEPLSGYLLIAERLMEGDDRAEGGWNFGPAAVDVRPVQWVLERLCADLPGARWTPGPRTDLHEARLLALDSAKAREALGWSPGWNLEQAIQETAAWHSAHARGDDMRAFSLAQLRRHPGFGASLQRTVSASRGR
jgi:CDP-glucose 4,6-dehydratase